MTSAEKSCVMKERMKCRLYYEAWLVQVTREARGAASKIWLIK